MQKTPEEIKKGLEVCVSEVAACDVCPYIGMDDCMRHNTEDTLAYIQQLEHNWDELFEIAKQLERERDALEDDFAKVVKEIDDAFVCEFCMHKTPGYGCKVCDFEWRGVKNDG